MDAPNLIAEDFLYLQADDISEEGVKEIHNVGETRPRAAGFGDEGGHELGHVSHL